MSANYSALQRSWDCPCEGNAWHVSCASACGCSVKLSVIALDYNGTTARNDVMGPQVRDAIAAARSAGIIVLLVRPDSERVAAGGG